MDCQRGRTLRSYITYVCMYVSLGGVAIYMHYHVCTYVLAFLYIYFTHFLGSERNAINLT
jgi:hypothetical protein